MGVNLYGSIRKDGLKKIQIQILQPDLEQKKMRFFVLLAVLAVVATSGWAQQSGGFFGTLRNFFRPRRQQPAFRPQQQNQQQSFRPQQNQQSFSSQPQVQQNSFQPAANNGFRQQNPNNNRFVPQQQQQTRFVSSNNNNNQGSRPNSGFRNVAPSVNFNQNPSSNEIIPNNNQSPSSSSISSNQGSQSSTFSAPSNSRPSQSSSSNSAGGCGTPFEDPNDRESPRCPDAEANHFWNGKRFIITWLNGDNCKSFTGVQADNYCKAQGGRAVSLDTNEAAEHFLGESARHAQRYYWTGGRLDHKCKVLTWPSGAREGWTEGTRYWSNTGGWEPEPRPQPDNRQELLEGGEPETCLGILNNFYADGIKWHDVACHHKKPTICQLDN